MEAINRALGVECTFCHIADDWKRADKPEFTFARRMIHMTDGLSAGSLRSLGLLASPVGPVTGAA